MRFDPKYLHRARRSLQSHAVIPPSVIRLRHPQRFIQVNASIETPRIGDLDRMTVFSSQSLKTMLVVIGNGGCRADGLMKAH